MQKCLPRQSKRESSTFLGRVSLLPSSMLCPGGSPSSATSVFVLSNSGVQSSSLLQEFLKLYYKLNSPLWLLFQSCTSLQKCKLSTPSRDLRKPQQGRNTAVLEDHSYLKYELSSSPPSSIVTTLIFASLSSTNPALYLTASFPFEPLPHSTCGYPVHSPSYTEQSHLECNI